jgi:hypothetical protein
MAERKEKRHRPACPSCGRPVTSGFLPFKISEPVKMILVFLLIGYVMVSSLFLRMSFPPEMRRNNTPASFDSWMQPLSREPVFQIFVGLGIVLGVLIFYWDWFQEIYENWQRQREGSLKKHKPEYRYKCRSCGREWN